MSMKSKLQYTTEDFILGRKDKPIKTKHQLHATQGGSPRTQLENTFNIPKLPSLH